MNDSISDALTRIRNAYGTRKDSVDVKCSNHILKVCEILKTQGYIENYKKMEDNKQGTVKVYLKYNKNKPAVRSIQRASRPGRRRYVAKDQVYRVMQGYGIAILSTSKGLMTDNEARSVGVGGEVVCEVF